MRNLESTGYGETSCAAIKSGITQKSRTMISGSHRPRYPSSKPRHACLAKRKPNLPPARNPPRRAMVSLYARPHACPDRRSFHRLARAQLPACPRNARLAGDPLRDHHFGNRGTPPRFTISPGIPPRSELRLRMARRTDDRRPHHIARQRVVVKTRTQRKPIVPIPDRHEDNLPRQSCQPGIRRLKTGLARTGIHDLVSRAVRRRRTWDRV